jgi:hypothetical protein
MNLNITPLILFFIGVALRLSAQGTDEIKKIEFITLTRGAHEKVLITKDCVSIVRQTRTDEKEVDFKMKIKEADWQGLLNSIPTISPAEISSYQSPTNRRAFDGAWHSSITITTRDEKSYGHSFDNEEPNEKLQALMKNIRRLAESAGEKNKR